MTLPASPRVQFRAGDLLPALQARSGVAPDQETEGSLSQIASRDLQRYYHALRMELPTFSTGEASLIVDALNGTLVEPHTAQLLWAEVADGVRAGLADKWHVDGPALIARLRGLTYTQALAVSDAAERFWRGRYRRADLAAGLRQVGLVKEDHHGTR